MGGAGSERQTSSFDATGSEGGCACTRRRPDRMAEASGRRERWTGGFSQLDGVLQCVGSISRRSCSRVAVQPSRSTTRLYKHDTEDDICLQRLSSTFTHQFTIPDARMSESKRQATDAQKQSPQQPPHQSTWSVHLHI